MYIQCAWVSYFLEMLPLKEQGDSEKAASTEFSLVSSFAPKFLFSDAYWPHLSDGQSKAAKAPT